MYLILEAINYYYYSNEFRSCFWRNTFTCGFSRRKLKLIGFWQGTETNSLANQTWDTPVNQHSVFLLENLYLVPQHRVKLVEHVLAESGSMDGDSTSPPTNVARCHVCDDGRTETVGWGGNFLICRMYHVLLTQTELLGKKLLRLETTCILDSFKVVRIGWRLFRYFEKCHHNLKSVWHADRVFGSDKHTKTTSISLRDLAKTKQ